MIIGITGAMGGGKSTLLKAFDRAGIANYSADELAHRQYLPGSDLLGFLVERWGRGILNEDGTLNRQKTAEIVFADEAELDFLNRSIAPSLAKSIKELIGEARRQNQNIVLEIPLLFEHGYEAIVDKVVVVETPEPLRRERLIKRGVSADEASKRDAMQWSAEKKRQKADVVLANAGTQIDLEKQCDALITRWNLK